MLILCKFFYPASGKHSLGERNRPDLLVLGYTPVRKRERKFIQFISVCPIIPEPGFLLPKTLQVRLSTKNQGLLAPAADISFQGMPIKLVKGMLYKTMCFCYSVAKKIF